MSRTLYEQIYTVVATIPAGYVASYGSVAEAAGILRGARVVGWALRQLRLECTNIPWHRVVAKSGRISIINPHATPSQQVELLRLEGVVSIESKGVCIVVEPYWYTFAKSVTQPNTLMKNS